MRVFSGGGLAAICLISAGMVFPTIQAGNAAEISNSVNANSSGSGSAVERAVQIQGGPWFLAKWNIEAAPANYFRAHDGGWFQGNPNKKVDLDESFVDPDTGYPHSLPRGSFVASKYYFGNPGFGGTWVLEAEGDAEIDAGLIRNKYRVSAKRVEFDIDNNSKQSMFVRINRIGEGGLKSIRLFRKEDEARLNAGNHWSSRFIAEASKYDVIRTMDLQNTNTTFINTASDIAPTDFAVWGSSNGRKGKKSSLPLEPLFALGVEANNSIWFQAPIHLGFPYDWDDPGIINAPVNKKSIGKMRFLARKHYEEIIESDEWDKYADAVVSALEAVEYPEDRMIYISLGNEIWNYGSWGFARQSRYADGIGSGYVNKEDGQNRVAYGVLSARLMMAFDGAFERAGRNQKRIHVVESQAANPWGSRKALEFAKSYIEKKGGQWSNYSPRLGVSVASYWGSRWTRQMPMEDWQALIASDPEEAKRIRADFILNGPANTVGTLPWILQKFKGHQKAARSFGVELIGAYEGGSHDSRPKEVSRRFYRSYLWGPVGAQLNESVNDAILEEFPGFILSNYALGGASGGGAWNDGAFDEDNAMKRSWAKYQRP